MLPTLAGTYNATLVTVSVIVAALASYVALLLASRVIATSGRERLAWLLGGAVAMGAGIWAIIANVVKHSAAHTVRLGLSYGARAMRLSVNDDGRGFAVDPDFHSYGGHWGLLGMWERASQIRAKLSVRKSREISDR